MVGKYYFKKDSDEIFKIIDFNQLSNSFIMIKLYDGQSPIFVKVNKLKTDYTEVSPHVSIESIQKN